MGTRGAYGFHKNGKDKITYNHYDSYPDFLGDNILDFIENTSDEEFDKIFDKIELVNEDNKPTKEQIKECKKFLGDLSGHTEDEWYNLLRKSQGNLYPYKNAELKYMIGGYEEFIKNSLFCEYAYVINLDTKELEFYVGYQKEPDDNRYRLTKEEKKEAEKNNCGCYNCKLVKTYSLNDIRLYKDDILEDMNTLK